MLLSVLLQAAVAGVGVSKLGAAIGAGLAVIGAGVVSVKSAVLPWRPLPVSRKHPEISV